jgi:hypothetical protein
MRLSTGVMVIYADDKSFTFMTPEGHMFAGWITFSAMEQDGATEGVDPPASSRKPAFFSPAKVNHSSSSALFTSSGSAAGGSGAAAVLTQWMTDW